MSTNIEIADQDDLTISVETVIGRLKTMTIETDTDYESAAEFVKKVKATAKVVESFFEEDYQRHYSAYKAVLAERKFFTDKLDAAEKAVKAKMSAFATAREKKAREEAAERQRAAIEAQRMAETAGETVAVVPDVVAEPSTVKPEGVSEVLTWHFEVENPDQIPREYLVVDEKKIGAVVRAGGGTIQIPGVKIWSTKEIRVRA